MEEEEVEEGEDAAEEEEEEVPEEEEGEIEEDVEEEVLSAPVSEIAKKTKNLTNKPKKKELTQNTSCS